MTHLLFLILILTTATVSFGQDDQVDMNEIYAWKYVDFEWENETQKENAINSGNYDPSACILYGMEKASDGRMFVTVARTEGVPATLTTMSNKTGPGGPLLIPYPNWSLNDASNCKNILNVHRLYIACNFLFVLDSSKGGINCNNPSLLIFDLEDDTLVKRISIPSYIANNKNDYGFLATLYVYVKDCKHINDATVFMADVGGAGLVMYNEMSGFCRIESTSMIPTDPYFMTTDGIYYMNFSTVGLTSIHNNLYYSVLSSEKIYKMDMSNLQKRNCSGLNESEVDNLTEEAGTLSGQSGPITSEQCAIFFSNIPESSILCQDATKTFHSNNTELIAQDFEKLQYVTDMKVTNNGTNLMCLSSQFKNTFGSIVDVNETNFRIFVMQMDEIRNKTKCFASCKDYEKSYCEHEHWHGKHWRGGPWHGRHSHGGLWHGRPLHGRSQHDKPNSKPWFRRPYNEPSDGLPWHEPWHERPHDSDKHPINIINNKPDKNVDHNNDNKKYF